MNTTLIFRTERESPWLLWQDSKGVRLCVNSNPIRLWVGRISISWPLVRHIIVEVWCQSQCYLQKSFTKHDLN